MWLVVLGTPLVFALAAWAMLSPVFPKGAKQAAASPASQILLLVAISYLFAYPTFYLLNVGIAFAARALR